MLSEITFFFPGPWPRRSIHSTASSRAVWRWEEFCFHLKTSTKHGFSTPGGLKKTLLTVFLRLLPPITQAATLPSKITDVFSVCLAGGHAFAGRPFFERLTKLFLTADRDAITTKLQIMVCQSRPLAWRSRIRLASGSKRQLHLQIFPKIPCFIGKTCNI